MTTENTVHKRRSANAAGMAVREVEELRRLRLAKDWTYLRLAQDCGFKESSIRRILTTDRPHRIWERTVVKLRDYLARPDIRRYLDALREADRRHAKPRPSSLVAR